MKTQNAVTVVYTTIFLNSKGLLLWSTHNMRSAALCIVHTSYMEHQLTYSMSAYLYRNMEEMWLYFVENESIYFKAQLG